ncbi:hypothetical protein B296_00044800 [Ensete ventricosum]|uniref:Uncharacterized protein n=1 Tax=Ensete ventricosum TaxID=4639 RepID=A0A426XBP4_ENSVE|nr:hypothetical protein B296_00044800 [Ensete ventricosum]
MVDRLQAADGVGSHRKQRNSGGSGDREGRRGSRDGSDSKWWGGERRSRKQKRATGEVGCCIGTEEIGEGAATVTGEGYRRGGRLLAAVGGIVNVAGQRLAVTTKAKEG